MQINQLNVSCHAARRMAQCNLSPSDIEAVISFGHTSFLSTATLFFLGWRDVARGLERKLERLVGTSVVTIGNRIIAVSRSAKVLTRIKRKSKHPVQVISLR
ncbi:MAG TPA: hypothetical protein VJ464_22430 [Blastocatellia bacterium]|nr:hypothetical protein [Blastocatellia bacterium]